MNTYNALSIESFTIETITPERAAQLLKNNKANRKIRSSVVSAYAAEMLADNWRTTHQGIAINGANELVDGQHRLEAIIKSGKSIKMAIIRYKEKCTAIGSPFDQHSKRNISDISGIPIRTANILSFIYRELLIDGRKDRLMSEVIDMGYMLNHRLSWIEENLSSTCRRIYSTAPIQAAVYLAHLSGSDWADQYNALSNLAFDRMEPETMVLYKKLIPFDGCTTGPRFRQVAFGATYFIATTNEEVKMIRMAAINDAITQAKIFAKSFFKPLV